MKTTTSRVLLGIGLAAMLPPIAYFGWSLFGPENVEVDNVQFITFTIWSIVGLVFGPVVSIWLATALKNGRWLWLLVLGLGDAASLFVGLVGTTVARMH